MIRTAIAVAATTLWLAGNALAQQQPAPAAPPPVDFSKVEIKTTDLGDGIYMLEGQGGNITVATANNGIIMVDGEFAPLHDKIKDAISLVSNQPVKYLINTHFHGDHTGGNAPFAKDGVIVVSEVNVKNRLAAGTTNGLTGVKTPPAAAEALPAKDLYRGFQDQARRPRRRPQAYRQRPYRRRHLCLVQDRQRARDRRHLHQRPLSQYRLRQWRQHQGHDRGDRSLSEVRQRQDADRAGSWPDRRQGGARSLSHHARSPRATAWRSSSRTARARTTWWRQSPSPISMPNGRRRIWPARISFAWSITRSPTNPTPGIRF